MDLWIRNQKGRLTQIVDILEPILDEWDKKEGWCLYGYSACQSFVPLAMYETKKRALEVLDEIQECLEDDVFRYTKDGYPDIPKNISTYEMPKE